MFVFTSNTFDFSGYEFDKVRRFDKKNELDTKEKPKLRKTLESCYSMIGKATDGKQLVVVSKETL